MAFKSMVGPSFLLAAFVALSGCQNTPQRNTTTPNFIGQKSGSTNPPVVYGNAPPSQPSGVGTSMSTAAPGGMGGIPTSPPTTTPGTAGSQFRSTAPYGSPSGPGLGAPGFGSPNTTPAPVSPVTAAPFETQTIVPPPSPVGPAFR